MGLVGHSLESMLELEKNYLNYMGSHDYDMARRVLGDLIRCAIVVNDELLKRRDVILPNLTK